MCGKGNFLFIINYKILALIMKLGEVKLAQDIFNANVKPEVQWLSQGLMWLLHMLIRTSKSRRYPGGFTHAGGRPQRQRLENYLCFVIIFYFWSRARYSHPSVIKGCCIFILNLSWMNAKLGLIPESSSHLYLLVPSPLPPLPSPDSSSLPSSKVVEIYSTFYFFGQL